MHELALLSNHSFGIIRIKAPYIHLQRIHIVIRVGGHIYYGSTISISYIKVFVHWIYDDYLIISRQKYAAHLHLAEEGFTGTRHSENEAISVDELLSVTDIHILADLVDTIVIAGAVIKFLHIEWHKHRK